MSRPAALPPPWLLWPILSALVIAGLLCLLLQKRPARSREPYPECATVRSYLRSQYCQDIDVVSWDGRVVHKTPAGQWIGITLRFRVDDDSASKTAVFVLSGSGVVQTVTIGD